MRCGSVSAKQSLFRQGGRYVDAVPEPSANHQAPANPPPTKRQTPSAKRKAPNASAKRQTPTRRQPPTNCQAPSAKQAPSAMRRRKIATTVRGGISLTAFWWKAPSLERRLSLSMPYRSATSCSVSFSATVLYSSEFSQSRSLYLRQRRHCTAVTVQSDAPLLRRRRFKNCARCICDSAEATPA